MSAKSIVCGVTGSENSEKAVRAASQMALAQGARLTLVYVVDVGFLSGLTVQLRPKYAADFLERLGGKILDEAATLASSLGVAAKKVLRTGKVMDEVIKVIKEESADLLVVGDEGHLRGKSALWKLCAGPCEGVGATRGCARQHRTIGRFFHQKGLSAE